MRHTGRVVHLEERRTAIQDGEELREVRRTGTGRKGYVRKGKRMTLNNGRIQYEQTAGQGSWTVPDPEAAGRGSCSVRADHQRAHRTAAAVAAVQGSLRSAWEEPGRRMREVLLHQVRLLRRLRLRLRAGEARGRVSHQSSVMHAGHPPVRKARLKTPGRKGDALCWRVP